MSSLVGLGAALQLWLRIAPSARAHVTRLATLLKQGALAIDGVSVVTPMDPEHSTVSGHDIAGIWVALFSSYQRDRC